MAGISCSLDTFEKTRVSDYVCLSNARQVIFNNIFLLSFRYT
jgi:hypothetical protein